MLYILGDSEDYIYIYIYIYIYTLLCLKGLSGFDCGAHVKFWLYLKHQVLERSMGGGS
jgi:hypothetical protein